MDKVIKENIAKLSLEELVTKIQRLESDEHVLLARKADSARNLLMLRMNELCEERVRGIKLERQGLSHEYLDRLLGGED